MYIRDPIKLTPVVSVLGLSSFSVIFEKCVFRFNRDVNFLAGFNPKFFKKTFRN
jgi:hypothetical protein